MAKKVSDFKTAKIYASALYESAQSANNLQSVFADIKTLKNTGLSEINEASCLSNPIVETNIKYEIIEAVSQKLNLSTQTINMLKLLTESGHFKILDQILSDFILIYNKNHSIAEINVETVKELSIQQDELLKEKLSDLFKQNIKINYCIKPEILGGLVIKNGTTRIDLSLKNQLKKIEQLMKGTD